MDTAHEIDRTAPAHPTGEDLRRLRERLGSRQTVADLLAPHGPDPQTIYRLENEEAPKWGRLWLLAYERLLTR
jgi:hypothetical protein